MAATALETGIRFTAARGLAPSDNAGHSRVLPHELHDVGEERLLHRHGANLAARLLQPAWLDRERFPRRRVDPTSNPPCTFDSSASLPPPRDTARGSSPESDRAAPPAADRCLRTRSGFCVANTVKNGDRGVPVAVDRDLALLHALEQRGLRARRHAVDFVDQQQVVNTGPLCNWNVPVDMFRRRWCR